MIKKIKHLYYNLIYGIQNIFVWFPTIWKDRNWDGEYVYCLLYQKIKLMEKHNKPCNHYIGQEKSLKKIIEVKEILKRIIRDEYLINELKVVEEKFGEWRLEFTTIDGNKYQTMIDNRSKEHKIAWTNASRQADYLKEQDKDNLFVLLRNNLDKWWT